jgi:hypothetical protein
VSCGTCDCVDSFLYKNNGKKKSCMWLEDSLLRRQNYCDPSGQYYSELANDQCPLACATGTC